MTRRKQHSVLRRCAICLTVAAICAGSRTASAESFADLVQRTSQQVSAFLEQFSDVKCTEQVRQEKLDKNGKVELHEDSTYDYLVILTNTGGELGLDESRLAVHEARADKKQR